MDFKNIPVSCHPAYAWAWNTEITREGIRKQLDEMYDSGVRVFYVLPLPMKFRPENGRTPLSPEYLSDEYIDLLYESFEYADSKGMVCWLYNEGGWPSGMACGKVRRELPDLPIRGIGTEKILLPAGRPYIAPDRLISAFADGRQIFPGEVFDTDREVIQYSSFDYPGPRPDNADRRTTDRFIELTHEAIARRFGEHLGREVTVMFDDESTMGPWTDGLDRMFREKYGYDLADFMPWIAPDGLEPVTEEQCRARSDYAMLCGELMRDNYFLPMKEWLNARGMLSMGHLNDDNKSHGPAVQLYGNMLELLRCFDVPGVDVIWSQITWPENGRSCPGGYEFFPRLASSAARHQGHHFCISESFAVYGAHLTPEEMQYIIGFQAVRGISQFNFMSMSYDRSGPMSLQFRPNFQLENPGMDCLGQLNEYTARLSYILQKAEADISTALYYPLRTICAGGSTGAKAAKAFEEIGCALEAKGVSFDLVDEAFVRSASVENGVLKGKYVSYANVFVPEAGMEPDDVVEKLSAAGKETAADLISRPDDAVISRKLLFSDGSEGYLLCNTAADTVSGTVCIASGKTPYLVDLFTGDLYDAGSRSENGCAEFSLSMKRGETVFVWLTAEPQDAGKHPDTEFVCNIPMTGFISRSYTIDPKNGPKNEYFTSGKPIAEGEWDVHFSGEATYTAVLPEMPEGELLLDLGEVRHFAAVYLNGELIGERILPPYRLSFRAKEGDELKVTVVNTIANVCHDAEYFDIQGVRHTGPYHANMKKYEAKAPAGGLIGPVSVFKVR